MPQSSKIRFLCGEQETSWPELATTTLVASNVLTTPGIDSHILMGAQKSVDKLIVFRSQRIQHLLVSFLDILQIFRYSECLDPRDKVYAPLCIAPDDVRRYIRPDYANTTVLDVYADVVRYYLAQPGHGLDFLGQKSYLLMIPNTAVVGDLIWALAGGQALYILRPMNPEIKQYRFISECYAHGLMDGDILRRLHLGEVKMEDVSLV